MLIVCVEIDELELNGTIGPETVVISRGDRSSISISWPDLVFMSIVERGAATTKLIP